MRLPDFEMLVDYPDKLDQSDFPISGIKLFFKEINGEPVEVEGHICQQIFIRYSNLHVWRPRRVDGPILRL